MKIIWNTSGMQQVGTIIIMFMKITKIITSLIFLKEKVIPTMTIILEPMSEILIFYATWIYMLSLESICWFYQKQPCKISPTILSIFHYFHVILIYCILWLYYILLYSFDGTTFILCYKSIKNIINFLWDIKNVNYCKKINLL